MMYADHLNSKNENCAYDKNCTHGAWSQWHDITIEGGTWDCNMAKSDASYSGLTFRHGQNLTIKMLLLKIQLVIL